MKLAIVVVGMAIGMSGSVFAVQSNEPAPARSATTHQKPSSPCIATEPVSHATEANVTGVERMAINTKGAGCSNGVVTPNKHPEGMKQEANKGDRGN